jgi:hypothetical protein
MCKKVENKFDKTEKLCYNRYRNWMKEQSKEFIRAVHPSGYIPDTFKNENLNITLKELEELDNRFINNAQSAESKDD